MKRISVGIGVALLAFFVGIVASTVKLRLSHKSAVSRVSPTDKEWHRLYEAAGLSGDSDILREVNDRLRCANKAGVPDAWPRDIDSALWCRRADGTIHQLREDDTNEYGSFSKHIVSTHSAWVQENLDFVATISTRETAKEYIATHEWPFFNEATHPFTWYSPHQ